MNIRINPQPKFVNTNFYSTTPQRTKNNNDKKSSDKLLMYSLAGIGIIALGILIAKGHLKSNKKAPIEDIKKNINNNIKIKDLSESEKEKLIKELQAKTDNPETKSLIRRLIENGEWDNL